MPHIMFDYVDGTAASEYACTQNIELLDQLRLQPGVLVNTESRNLGETILRKRWLYDRAGDATIYGGTYNVMLSSTINWR